VANQGNSTITEHRFLNCAAERVYATRKQQHLIKLFGGGVAIAEFQILLHRHGVDTSGEVKLVVSSERIESVFCNNLERLAKTTPTAAERGYGR